jgi:hypothetical protein
MKGWKDDTSLTQWPVNVAEIVVMSIIQQKQANPNTMMV